MARDRNLQKELKRQGYYDQFSKEARARREQQYRDRQLNSKAESGYNDPVPKESEKDSIARERMELEQLRRKMIREARAKVKATTITKKRHYQL